MKKWKCTVCGYLHEGDTPPEECPLCKAPAEKFEEVIEVETAEEVSSVKPTARTETLEQPVDTGDVAEESDDTENEATTIKRWRCTVCGYIHEGDTPPEECPLCKAPAEKFEEIVETEPDEEVTSIETEELSADPEEMEETVEQDEKMNEAVVTSVATKRWRCNVCGYIHEQDTKPDECPICKAASNKFVEVDSEGNEKPKEKKKKVKKAKGVGPSLLVRLIMKLHVHPISVHMPNGILPVAVIFLAVSIFLGMAAFETAAFYNMVFVLATLPVVLLTGFVEWKNRYMGAKTFIFFTKIACSVIVTLSLIALIAWRAFDPTVAGPDSPFRMIYFGIACLMLVATGIAGHLGGKLVFGTRGE